MNQEYAAPLPRFLIENLMPDLVGHDRRPAAFLVFLYFWFETHGKQRASILCSHAAIAEATGLSKSAVQKSILHLVRRGLIESSRKSLTDVPKYCVLVTRFKS